MFGPNAVVFFNTTAKVRLNDDSISPLQLAQDIQDAVNRSGRYCYVQTEDLIDGDCTDTRSSCTENQIAAFLLAVQKGAILVCNGWDEQFGYPLGDPLGPAEQNGDMVQRKFKSGTNVTWSLSKNEGKVNWAKSEA